MRVESASISGRWLEPRGVVYYGYFEDAGVARRALALGATPMFPDVGATLPLDERAVALLLASRADEPGPPRGYVPAGLELTLEREQVLKWGNRHCGEDKVRAIGSVQVTNAAVIEPFVEGRSERVLVVGEHVWHLRYESSDWRKNVRATVEEIAPDAKLVARARQTARHLGLAIAGVDYVVGESGATLLEVNAYPGLDDVPAAVEAFVELARGWWERLHRPAVSDAPSELSSLHDELNAADGSFLLQLRVNLRWDAAAFRRLAREMFTYVRSRNPRPIFRAGLPKAFGSQAGSSGAGPSIRTFHIRFQPSTTRRLAIACTISRSGCSPEDARTKTLPRSKGRFPRNRQRERLGPRCPREEPMHFADLERMPEPRLTLVAVGWLASGHAYEQGAVDEEFFSSLMELLVESLAALRGSWSSSVRALRVQRRPRHGDVPKPQRTRLPRSGRFGERVHPRPRRSLHGPVARRALHRRACVPAAGGIQGCRRAVPSDEKREYLLAINAVGGAKLLLPPEAR